MEYLRKKISRSNYIINKLKNTLPQSSLITLYQTMVQCHLNYGIEIWGSGSNVDKIYKLQKKTIRVINNVKYNHHTEPLFKINQILAIKDLHTLNCLVFMHKLKNNKMPDSFNGLNYFIPPRRAIREIYSHMAQIRRHRTKYSSLLPLHKFPKIWNDLNLELQRVVSISVFKREVRSYLMGKYRETVYCDNIQCRQCHQI